MATPRPCGGAAHNTVQVGGHTLEYVEIGGTEPALVFLHEGLGSVSLWRDFPARIAQATGRRTVVYSRHGYGQSSVLETPFGADYMHLEGRKTLPALLRVLEIDTPVLIGHSDGGSIALIAAGQPDTSFSGLVVMAPHVFVEPVSLSSIQKAGEVFATTNLAERMAKHHRDPERTFRGWHDVWLSDAFRDWNIEDCLAGITCPVLAIQGNDDEYGTRAQVDAVAAGVSGPCSVHILDACRHAPHQDQADLTAGLISRFISGPVKKDAADGER